MRRTHDIALAAIGLKLGGSSKVTSVWGGRDVTPDPAREYRDAAPPYTISGFALFAEWNA